MNDYVFEMKLFNYTLGGPKRMTATVSYVQIHQKFHFTSLLFKNKKP